MLDMIFPFAYLPSFRDGQIDVRNLFERVPFRYGCSQLQSKSHDHPLVRLANQCRGGESW